MRYEGTCTECGHTAEVYEFRGRLYFDTHFRWEHTEKPSDEIDPQVGRWCPNGRNQNRRVRIHWLDTQTGQKGVYEDKPGSGSIHKTADGDDDFFMWEDGNYACDCNRGLFFLEDRETDFPCDRERFDILSCEAFDDDSNLDRAVVPGRKRKP